MSQPDSSIQATPQSCSPRSRCRRKRCLLIGLLLGTLVAIALFLICPPQYEAKTLIQIYSTNHQFLADSRKLAGHEYDRFVDTQIALMQTPMVLDRVLETPEVARLPVILQQKDKRTWLARKLHVKRLGNSEIVQIGIKTSDEHSSATIINTIMDVYCTFIEDVFRQTESSRINNLNAEKRFLALHAQQVQESMRARTKQAAAQKVPLVSQEESLASAREAAETKLLTLQVQRKAIMERIANPSQVPPSILLQMNPELTTLNEQKESLMQQRKAAARIISKPEEDARIQDMDRKISIIENKITELSNDADGSGQQSVQDKFRLQEEVNLFQLEQEIRTQEILVETLKQKFFDQLEEDANRAENTVDTAFDQAQLNWINKTLDKIEDRLISLRSEQRAPGQIVALSRAVSSMPSRTQSLAAAGLGFILVFVLTLLGCSICRKRREE